MGKARNYIPALKFGHKIYPEDLAGMIGLPYVGNIQYIDPTGGSDTGGSGESANNAVATVAQAYSNMTANQHDVAIIVPTGGTGRTTETTAITWAKRYTHLIGSAAPTAQDVRAGIGFGAGGSLIISENGNLFKNLTMFSSEDIDETVSVTGDYNSFLGIDFKGTSNATSADSTPWRALNLNGAQENYFGGCTFGADTYTRGVANATLELENASSRNVFEDCRFTMHADTAETQLHVLLTGTNAVDRWIEFKDCSFYAFYTNHTAKVNAVFNNSAQSTTADILMTGNNLAVGFDDWEATAASGIMWFPQFQDTNPGTYVGIGINNVT